MKKLVITFCALITGTSVFAADLQSINASIYGQQSYNTPISSLAPNRTDFYQCISHFSINSEELFYLTLSALNKMNYQIKEIQSKTGTVLFTSASKEFMITISSNNISDTFMKILPTDGNYSFSPVIVQNIFGYISSNIHGISSQII